MMEKTMHKTALITIAGLFVITTISGCGVFKKKKSTTALPGTRPALSNEFTFSDIPVPRKFKLDRENSYAFQDSKTRIGLLRYLGRSKIDDVSIFYQQQMPFYGWQEARLVDYDKSVQYFDKEKQTCLITVERVYKPFLFIIPWPKTLVTINTVPAGQGFVGASGFHPRVPDEPVDVIVPK